MSKIETGHDRATRLVEEQRAGIDRQRRLIATLSENGAGTEAARQRLYAMEASLAALRSATKLYACKEDA